MTPQTVLQTQTNRIRSIDFMRGLVMVIMALDHTRDLIHIDSLTGDPLNLKTTTLELFATRWITHLCAPAFVFLSGASAWLSFQKSGSEADTRKFLLTRGLWLILLEFTIVNLGIWFNIRFEILMQQVIAAIGFGMIILSLLLKLSPRAVGLLGLTIILGHGLLQGVSFEKGAALQYVWTVLFKVGLFQIPPKTLFFVSYPLIPWLGILLAGYGFAAHFSKAQTDRKKLFLKAGCGALILFLLLRSLNLYGDPSPWATQKKSLFSLLSFVNVSKYPPSLLFVLLMLAIALLIMSWAEGKDGKLIRFFSVYGRVPMFYYLVHWYLIHGTLVLFLLLQGFRWVQLDFSPFRFGRPEGVDTGVDLGLVYLIWLGVVLTLYPLCRWYDKYKRTHPEKRWLRFL